jgi:hypothetical protein
VAVPDDGERRLPVKALHGEQRAERAAPAAPSAQQNSPGERDSERAEQKRSRGGTAPLEQRDAQRHEQQEQRDRDEVAVLTQQPRRRERARPAESPGSP